MGDIGMPFLPISAPIFDDYEYNEAISYLSRLKCVSLPFFKKYWSPLYLFPVARRISG
jgi:hypothetical protein